jgi:LacI family transcriptional regulator
VKTRTTIHDIGKNLGLTPATVSRALNDSSEISDKTKDIVRAEAKRLNYQRNKIASSLRSGRSNVIGVLIPSAEHVFFGSVILGISNLATEYGYDVLIYQSNEMSKNEVKGVNAFLSANVAGILASVAKDTEDYSHFISARKRGTPVVFFDRANDSLGIPSVVIDDFKGAYLATEQLILQGYKRVAHITGPLNIQAFRERLEGYKAALRKYKMKMNAKFIIEGNISIESGKENTRKLLSLHNPPDAIFAVEDLTALGTLKELKRQRIHVPKKFGVFGFCNDGFSAHVTPSISSIDQQTIVMGQEAFRLIHEVINQTIKRDKKIILEPLLFIRESSQRKKSV